MGFGGFSWKRATGVTKMKSKVSRATGIPLTKSGRQRKIGKIVTGGGCLVVLGVGIAAIVVTTLAWPAAGAPSYSHSQQAVPDYTVTSVEDISMAGAVRLRVRVQLTEHVGRDAVVLVAEEIAADLSQSRGAKAIAFFFSGPNADANDGFDVARADWAPNGVWADAVTARDGDYSTHRVTIQEYIEPVSRDTALTLDDEATAMFEIPLPVGATLVESTEASAGVDASETYEIEASKADLVGFYQLHMPEGKWLVTSTFSEGAMVFWKKGRTEVAISVGDGRINIMGAVYDADDTQ